MVKMQDSMRAIIGGKLVTAPIPQPKSGEVLIRIEATPIHHLDLVCDPGHIPGQEGSGIVVANGGGLSGWKLVNKRVTFLAPHSWAEYVVVPTSHTIVLTSQTTFDEAALGSLIPLTAMMMFDYSRKHTAVLLTAANSSLGQTFLRWCHFNSVNIVNVVRSNSGVPVLSSLGATHVLVQDSVDFKEQLRTLCLQLGVTAAFDLVGGKLTSVLLEGLPDTSTVYMVANVSEQPVAELPVSEFILHNKRVEGLKLSRWLKQQNFLSSRSNTNKIQELLNTVLRTEVSGHFPLEQLEEAVLYSKEHPGKVLLKPSLRLSISQRQ
jgi:NADPH:quinone reductase-like Zn-dependent oxidoreductase